MAYSRGREAPKQVLTIRNPRVGTDQGEVIPAYNVIKVFAHVSGDRDVVPRLRVLGDDDIPGPQSECLDLSWCCRCLHEVYAARDVVVLVDINVVAETDSLLSLDCLLI